MFRQLHSTLKPENLTFPFSVVRDSEKLYVLPFLGCFSKSSDGLCMASVTTAPSRIPLTEGRADTMCKVRANLGSKSTGMTVPEKRESMTIAFMFARM